ncbi:MAG: hypothetical protein K6A42_00550, partial [Treponema sp.]|nr:hypothetical protein [Treponema sp.]
MNGTFIVSDFDIVSFFVSLAVAFYTYTKYSEQNQGNRAFKRMVFCALLLCATDFFSSLTVNIKAGVFFELLAQSVYIFSLIAFSQSILAYTNAYIHTRAQVKKEKKRMMSIFFP